MNKISMSVYLLHMILQKPASKSFTVILQLATYGNNTQPIHDFLERSQCKSTSMKIFTLYKINDSRRKLGIKIIIQISIQEYNGRIAGVHNQIRYLNILAKPNNKQGTRLMHAQTPKFAYLDQGTYNHTMVHCGGRKVHSSFIIITPHKKTHAFRDFFLSDCQIQHSRFPLHNKSKRQKHQK